MNSLGIALEGQTIVMTSDIFPNEDLARKWRIVTVTGGFGAQACTNGIALFCTALKGGETAWFSAMDVERIATAEDLQNVTDT